VQLAREQAIDSIGGGGEDQNQQRPVISLVKNQNEKKWQEAQTQKRDLVGNRPDARFH
jgi:hypothetical protein